MLGAIIGDLAAWTYTNRKEVFYSQLVSDSAQLSEYGEAALQSALAICNGKIDTLPPAEYYHQDDEHSGIRLIMASQAAWTDGNYVDCFKRVADISDNIAEKAGFYENVSGRTPVFRRGKKAN